MVRETQGSDYDPGSQELSSSRFTMIIGVTAVLFFLGLLPLEAIPEIPVDIDSKPFFIPLVLTALLPAGRAGIAIGLGVALGEFLRDLMEGYELDDPIGFVGYFLAFALTSYLFGKQPPGRIMLLFAGLFCGFVQAAIEASSFLLFGEESMGIVIQSTIGNTIMHGVIWGAIPAFFLVPILKGRFEHYLGFPTKGEVLEREPLKESASGFEPADDAVAWVSALSFRYPSSAEPALNSVSLDCRAGEVLGLIGPAMSGKSTLCRVLAEVAPRATGGEIVGALNLGAEAVDIGYVADTPAAMMTRSHALNEVEAALEHLDIGGEEATQRAAQVLEDVGIGQDQARQYIWELSRNSQMMVALAAAMASAPKLLVLDELAADLDASGLAILQRVMTAHCERGGAVLLVDNSVDRLWHWADRVAILDRGALVAIGEREAVLGDKASLARVGFAPPSEVLLRAVPSAASVAEQVNTPTPRTGPQSRKANLQIESLVYAPSDGASVFSGVTLEVGQGAIVGIAAPSGAGKSTLAKLIGGILEPQSGSISIAGASLDGEEGTARTARVAVVMHDPSAFFSEATIREEIAMPLRRAKWSDDRIAQRIAELAGQLHIEDLLDRDPNRLSIGTARLAQIAAVLALDAHVLVLDEVAARLDPSERSRLIATVREFAAREGSVIILDHDCDFLAEMCAQLYLIEGGRIVALGTPEQAFASEQLARLEKSDLAAPHVARMANEAGLGVITRSQLALIAASGGPFSVGEGRES